jgi:PPM family protein phosphatase
MPHMQRGGDVGWAVSAAVPGAEVPLGGTHPPGLVRDDNEDSAFAGPYLQLVADGVGGAAAGKVASATATYVTSALTMAPWSGDLLEVLGEAVRLAHEQLRAGVSLDPARAGMGSTLTALHTDGERVALVHVGDSRAYQCRDGGLVQLTRDDTFVQSLADQGLLTAAEARRHPRRNVVVQALDGQHPATPALSLVDVRLGDRLLVCSDGPTDLVEDHVVRAHLAVPDREAAADALVAAVLAAGGLDNLTCLVSDVVDGPRLDASGARLGALEDPRPVVDPTAVHAATR